jgi:hypothetical protein
MSTRFTCALAVALLVACDRSGGSGSNAADASVAPSTAASASSASVAPPASAPKRSSLDTPLAAIVPGLGEVPSWTGDKPTKQCPVGAAAKPRLEAIAKGTDAAVSAGTADLPALVKEVGADTCFATRRALAASLATAGSSRYAAKSYEEATRYSRAALVVRPSLVTARYDLARGLALTDKKEQALAQLAELARATSAGEANAALSLEKAKTDKDLDGVRSDPAFQAAVQSTNAGLVGPRKEPELGAKVVALLPDDFRKQRDLVGATPTGGGMITYKPAVANVWTWHPDPSTELLVATIIDDPAKLGVPKPDLHMDYGAIAILKRDAAGKVTLLTVRKTGYTLPTIAAGKDGTLIYSFEQVCGALSGVFLWDGTSIDFHEKNCREL